ncbi:MAG: hypothetical protein AB8B99_06620 [Phormidesmis sp.]
MQTLDIEKTSADWLPVAEKVFVPHSETEYNQLVSLLDSLIDRVGGDETHPLASMMDVIGELIESYESKYVPELEEAA